ncbi:hypothetical protein JCM19237_338 [Photobacterium aphoticum]|uniref:Uncharacterized protein n=1 Tax=Photobacterium aphoticum TaxID=754436 RepID=A0A090R0C5_9GAMM|nr:hypothetical protein JCM19237_338 [Photobacterium aphoticum]
MRVVCEGQQYYLYYDLAEHIERLNIVQSNIEQYPIATSEADEVADINNSVVSSAFDLGLPVGEIVKNTELLIDEIPIDSFASDFQLE